MGVEHMGREAAVHLEAIGGLDPLVEAQRGDAEDFGERRFGLGRRAVVQTMLELPQDRILAVPPHADDERDGEFLAVGIVQAVKLREFRLRQTDRGRRSPARPWSRP